MSLVSLVAGVGLFVLGLILIGLVVRAFGRVCIRRSNRIAAPGIDFCDLVTIGGLPQWIQIRGENRGNPVILYLHGGPGGAMIATAHSRQRAWEQHFTIAHWDQRGSGKTLFTNFFRGGHEEVSFERLIEDVGEVIDFICSKLGQDKLFLLGHSWGTELGVPAAARYANRLHGYIGLGQVVSVLDNERVGYEWALRQAERRGNRKALEELRSIAPYPSTRRFEKSKLFTQRKWVARFGGSCVGVRHVEIRRLLQLFLSPYMSLRDLLLYFRVYHITGNLPYVELMHGKLGTDFRKSHTRFEIPVVLIEGRHDWQTPSVLAREWFELLEAPMKKWEWMESSGHYITVEEPEKFLRMLVDEVKPLAANTAPHFATTGRRAGA